MTDINNDICIQLLVSNFYDNIKQDKLLGPVFSAMIGDSEAHLYTMNSFWKVVLFGTPGYTENPFAKYDQFIITARHLERWLKLFQITVDTHFKGSKAEEAKVSAGKMAIVFQNKLARVRDKDRIIL